MKFLLYLPALIFLSACHSKSAEPNTDIHSTKTAKHVNVAGTRVFLVPPPGFTPSPTGTGFVKGGGASIIIFDLPNGSMAANSADFTKENFESKGIKVLSFGPAKVNGLQAKYAHMQGGGDNSYGLVFGDSSFCALIMCVGKISDHKTRDELLEAMNTIYYDKTQKLDPLKTALFSVDDPDSKFKVSSLSSDVFGFTLNNANASQAQGASVLYVMQSAIGNSTLEGFVRKTLTDAENNNGISDPKIIDVSTESINGYKTYKGHVDCVANGKRVLMYFCSVTNGNIVVFFQGAGTADYESEFQEYDKLVQTVKLR